MFVRNFTIYLDKEFAVNSMDLDIFTCFRRSENYCAKYHHLIITNDDKSSSEVGLLDTLFFKYKIQQFRIEDPRFQTPFDCNRKFLGVSKWRNYQWNVSGINAVNGADPGVQDYDLYRRRIHFLEQSIQMLDLFEMNNYLRVHGEPYKCINCNQFYSVRAIKQVYIPIGNLVKFELAREFKDFFPIHIPYCMKFMDRVLVINSLIVSVIEQDPKNRSVLGRSICYRKSAINREWYSIENGMFNKVAWFQEVLSYNDIKHLSLTSKLQLELIQSERIWSHVVDILLGTTIALYEIIDK